MSGHAILIGHDVDGWQADLSNVENWLRNIPGISFVGNITRIENGQATRGRIKEAIRAKGEFLTYDDFLVIYYSGHGMQKRSGAVGDEDGFCQVIKTQDGPLTDAEFWDLWVGFSDAVRVLFITDCCHSEGVASTLSDKTPRISLVHLSACSNSQQSRGNNNGGRFTNGLIAAMRAPGGDYEAVVREVNRIVALPDQEAHINSYGMYRDSFKAQRPFDPECLLPV